jgi:hypothetical protein
VNNAALASNTSVVFTLSNSDIAATDNLLVNLVSGFTSGAYLVHAEGASAGAVNIHLRNVSGGSLSEAVVLQFSIVNGSVN